MYIFMDINERDKEDRQQQARTVVEGLFASSLLPSLLRYMHLLTPRVRPHARTPAAHAAHATPHARTPPHARTSAAPAAHTRTHARTRVRRAGRRSSTFGSTWPAATLSRHARTHAARAGRLRQLPAHTACPQLLAYVQEHSEVLDILVDGQARAAARAPPRRTLTAARAACSYQGSREVATACGTMLRECIRQKARQR